MFEGRAFSLPTQVQKKNQPGSGGWKSKLSYAYLPEETSPLKLSEGTEESFHGNEVTTPHLHEG